MCFQLLNIIQVWRTKGTNNPLFPKEDSMTHIDEQRLITKVARMYTMGSYYWSVGKDRALNFEVIADEYGNRINEFVNGLSFLR